MSDFDLTRRAIAEALGTALLVATVVGSGIMAQTLTNDVALHLLGNTIPTGAILVVLITVLGPISGAHFNPAVSLVFTLRGELVAAEHFEERGILIALRGGARATDNRLLTLHVFWRFGGRILAAHESSVHGREGADIAHLLHFPLADFGFEHLRIANRLRQDSEHRAITCRA